MKTRSFVGRLVSGIATLALVTAGLAGSVG
jgi:hypothetical protein